mgnify:CR=1 FL=1
MNTYLVNLTPHDVDICDSYGRIVKTYRASGKVARVCNNYENIGYIQGIPLLGRKNDEIVDLPAPREGFLYIVSNVVLESCKDRTDLVAPAQQVKINGRTIGCMAFVGNKRKG